MTDYLETYRQMVRSMRFVPPLNLSHLSRESVPEPIPPAPIPSSSQKWRTANHEEPAPTPPIDLSKRAARLIQEAVSKPTVLPTTYAIPENPGDRISRLSTPKPTPASTKACFETSRLDSALPQPLTRGENSVPKEAESVAPDRDVPVPQTEDTPKPEIIEPAPVAVETVTPPQQEDKTETISTRSTPTVTCPQCQSSDIRENGHCQDKQQYRCKDCGRHFAIPEVNEVEEKPKLQKNTRPKQASTPPPPAATASSDRLFSTTKRRSKKKTKAKGFGSSKSGD